MMDKKTATEVAVIGAGPWGLSIACYLKARGLRFRIFGSPMQFWRDMPDGIALKSFDFASNIYTPKKGYTFIEYCKARGLSSAEPVPMSQFTEYGAWAQRELVPEVEDVQVTQLTRDGDSFVLQLSTGEVVRAGSVVMANGLAYFDRVPAELAIGSAHITHTSKQKDYAQFAGKDVTVIGVGQSALESAELLKRHGAKVRIIARGEGAWYADKMPEHRSLRERFRNPQSVMGPGRLNWILQTIPLFGHFLPERRRVRLTKRHLGPFGTWWLRDELEGQVPLLTGTSIEGAREEDSGIVLTVRDAGGTREIRTDHVILGTGYEVDVDRIPFLDPMLAASVTRIERSPRLNRKFESSVRGLYFVGPQAMFSFGPLVRFVCGAEFAAPVVARSIARSRATARQATTLVPEPAPESRS